MTVGGRIKEELEVLGLFANSKCNWSVTTQNKSCWAKAGGWPYPPPKLLGLRRLLGVFFGLKCTRLLTFCLTALKNNTISYRNLLKLSLSLSKAVLEGRHQQQQEKQRLPSPLDEKELAQISSKVKDVGARLPISKLFSSFVFIFVSLLGRKKNPWKNLKRPFARTCKWMFPVVLFRGCYMTFWIFFLGRWRWIELFAHQWRDDVFLRIHSSILSADSALGMYLDRIYDDDKYWAIRRSSGYPPPTPSRQT